MHTILVNNSVPSRKIRNRVTDREISLNGKRSRIEMKKTSEYVELMRSLCLRLKAIMFASKNYPK